MSPFRLTQKQRNICALKTAVQLVLYFKSVKQIISEFKMFTPKSVYNKAGMPYGLWLRFKLLNALLQSLNLSLWWI